MEHIRQIKVLLLSRKYALPRTWALIAAAAVACIGNLTFICAVTHAEFSRPFMMALDGTPTGPSGAIVHFERLEGIAAEGETGSGGGRHVWISDDRFSAPEPPSEEGVLDEFSSSLGTAPVFLRQLRENQLPQPPVSPITGLKAMHPPAFDDLTNYLYSAGSEEWIAIDNSPNMADPAAGDVYAAGARSEHGPGTSVRRFSPSGADPTGEPADFTCAEPNASEYIRGNELIGTPSELWEYAHIKGAAVDSSDLASAGDIYIINNISAHSEVIDEFSYTGCFVRAITADQAPQGFGDYLTGVTVDPTNGDVLVEVWEGDIFSAIDEFSSSGQYLGQITGTSSGPSDQFGQQALITGSIAVDAEGQLYVGNNESKTVDVFGPGAFYPGAVTGETSIAQPGYETLNGVARGAKNNRQELLEVSQCDFEYVTEAVYETSGFPAPNETNQIECRLESGSSPVHQRLAEKNYPVQADVSGLSPGTAYRYRLLVATSAAELGGLREGGSESFVAPDAPALGATSISNVSSSYAELHAEVDPRGADTTYQFQYIDAAAYETAVLEGASDPYAAGASTPVPAPDVGSGDDYVNVAASAGGLLPSTAYDFRVVASNVVGETAGENDVFVTMSTGGVGLPDDREYELMTPPNKGDAEDLFGEGKNEVNFDQGYASEDGDHFMLFTAAKFGVFPAAGENSYVFARGETGWSETSVASPELGVQSAFAEIYDPLDFSQVGVHDDVGSSEESVMDLVGQPGGGEEAYEPIALGNKEEYVDVSGASVDLSHVVVEGPNHKVPLCDKTEEALAEEVDAGSDALYEWTSARRCMSPIDVKSRSQGGGLLSRCGAVLGQSTERAGGAHDAVSGDGSKIFFTAPDPRRINDGAGCWNGGAANTPQLFMRSNGETTVEASAPEKGVTPPGGVQPAVYVGASSDGSRVFFVTKTELTADAVAAHTHEPELYEYDTETGKLVRVSRGESGQQEGNVIFVAAISPDGSTVYFDATGRLAAGAPEGGGLYRYDAATGTTTYVAAGAGYPGEIPGKWYQNGVVSPNSLGLEVAANDYTTGNGEFLVFESTGKVTSYDSDGQAELYRYERRDGSIVCLSCDPDGEPSHVGSEFARSALHADNPAGGPPRPISEDGEYVFFDTAEALVPQDTNGKVDVYEWHNGTVSLITTGQSASSSFFLDSSSYVNPRGETVEGGNVFFGTHSQLVPQDTDTEGDLYDARIKGGFATSAGTGPCEGDACDNPPLPPVFQAPATLTLASSGNFAPEVTTSKKATKKKLIRCPKGRRLSHGKCVGAKARHASRARRVLRARPGRRTGK